MFEVEIERIYSKYSMKNYSWTLLEDGKQVARGETETKWGAKLEAKQTKRSIEEEHNKTGYVKERKKL